MNKNKGLTAVPETYDNLVYGTDGERVLSFDKTRSEPLVSHDTRDDFAPVIALVLAGLPSENSRRAYRRALLDFLGWWNDQGRPRLSKSVVLSYRDTLGNLAPASINLRMAAIRRMVNEAADNGMIDQLDAQAIAKVHGAKLRGVRAGNWLTKDQAERLLTAPPADTVGGKRDRAILSLLIGAGLRRSEVANLRFTDIQQREGRWVILDLTGKGGRVRTVPLASWTKAAIDRWAEVLNNCSVNHGSVDSGYVFRPIRQGGLHLAPGDKITPQAVWRCVERWAVACGLQLAPHDCRRTWARLALKGGGALDQISLVLGHSSIDTTQRYLGLDLDLSDSPCDRLGLELS